MKYSEKINIRKGKEEDIASVFRLVEELAVHHKHDLEYIDNTAAQMQRDAFGKEPYFHFIVAEEAGEIVGATIYYFTYSTWKGKSLYLEDLIITRSHRGKGIGKFLMQALADEAVAHGARKMKWQVAEDNASAIGFYEKIAADLDPEWINCELSHTQLEAMSTDEKLEKELIPA
jgi:GNAT superfamily N-acetyltransferase